MKMPRPSVLIFEGLGECFYEIIEFRIPKVGEFYMCGEVPQAWKAPAGLHADYWIVRPTFKALPLPQVVRHIKGEPV